jgi:hypothetical protein
VGLSVVSKDDHGRLTKGFPEDDKLFTKNRNGRGRITDSTAKTTRREVGKRGAGEKMSN